ncbi:MAG: hypothetical protein ACFCUT_12825 [Kiloniellaceae bacterium]
MELAGRIQALTARPFSSPPLGCDDGGAGQPSLNKRIEIDRLHADGDRYSGGRKFD